MSEPCNLALGIELGFSKNRASIYFAENRIESLLTKTKDLEIPSYVSYTNTGIIVGSDAQKNVLRNFNSTIYGYLEVIGRSYSLVPKENNTSLIDIEGYPAYNILDQKISPEQVLGQILNYIREEADFFSKVNGIRDAVITVPAYFNHLQREAIIESSMIANLNVLQLINEVTAVVVSYCNEMKSVSNSRTILICHLGAVSFDLSLFLFDDRIITTKLSVSKSNIGGNQINKLILNWLLNEIKTTNNVNISELSKKVLYKLSQNIEKAKRELTFSEVSYIFVPIGNTFEVKLTRNTFNNLINTLMQQILTYINDNLQKVFVNHDEITDVLFTGGSFKILLLKHTLQGLFKNAMTSQTEHLAAEGAAIIAGQLKENRRTFTINEICESSLVFGNIDPSITLFKDMEYLPKTMEIVTTNKTIDICITNNVFEYITDSYVIQDFEDDLQARLTISMDCSGLIYIKATANNKELVVSKVNKYEKHQSNILVPEENMLMDQEDLRKFEVDIREYKLLMETLMIQDKYKEIFNNLCKEEWIKNDSIIPNKTFLVKKRKKIDTFFKFMRYISASNDEAIYCFLE